MLGEFGMVRGRFWFGEGGRGGGVLHVRPYTEYHPLALCHFQPLIFISEKYSFGEFRGRACIQSVIKRWTFYREREKKNKNERKF